MTEGELEHRLTVRSEQCDHSQSRLDDVERRQDSLVADILINECGLPGLVPIEFGGTIEKA